MAAEIRPTMSNVYVLRHHKDAEGFVLRSERVPLSHAHWLSAEEKEEILKNSEGAPRAEPRFEVQAQTEAFRT